MDSRGEMLLAVWVFPSMKEKVPTWPARLLLSDSWLPRPGSEFKIIHLHFLGLGIKGSGSGMRRDAYDWTSVTCRNLEGYFVVSKIWTIRAFNLKRGSSIVLGIFLSLIRRGLKP